jgi:tetratricopeptide (TPR) repeat protein
MRYSLLFIFLFTISFHAFSQVDTTLLIARAQFEDKQYNLAWKTLEQVSFKKDQYIEAFIKTAYYTGNYQEMMIAYHTLPQRKQHMGVLYLIKYYADCNLPDSAFFLLDKMLNNRIKPKRSYLRTDSTLKTLAVYPQWDSIWRLKHYNDFDLKIETAERELEVKNYKLALTLLDELIEDRPYREKPLFIRAKLFFEQGTVKSALDDIKLAIKGDDDVAEYHAFQAVVHLKLEQKRRALKSIQEALKLDPYQPDYYRIASLANELLENFEEAENHAKLYLRCFPNRAEAMQILARVYVKQNRCMSALPLLHKAIELQKYNPELYLLRAQAYQLCKVWKMAIKDFSMCMDFWPDKAELYLERGKCRHNIGQNSGACSDLRKAFDLGSLEADLLEREWCD